MDALGGCASILYNEALHHPLLNASHYRKSVDHAMGVLLRTARRVGAHVAVRHHGARRTYEVVIRRREHRARLDAEGGMRQLTLNERAKTLPSTTARSSGDGGSDTWLPDTDSSSLHKPAPSAFTAASDTSC